MKLLLPCTVYEWIYLYVSISKNKGIKINTKTDFVEDEFLLNTKENNFSDTAFYLTSIIDNKKLYTTSVINKEFIEFDFLNRKKTRRVNCFSQNKTGILFMKRLKRIRR